MGKLNRIVQYPHFSFSQYPRADNIIAISGKNNGFCRMKNGGFDAAFDLYRFYLATCIQIKNNT
jgi:hypothetical protein